MIGDHIFELALGPTFYVFDVVDQPGEIFVLGCLGVLPAGGHVGKGVEQEQAGSLGVLDQVRWVVT